MLRAVALSRPEIRRGTSPLQRGYPRQIFRLQVTSPMPHFRKPALVLWSFPCLVLLGGCEAKPECDSFETRNAVLQAVSSDHNNPLVKFAAGHSNEAKSNETKSNENKSRDDGSAAEKPAQQPLYVLGDEMITLSTSNHKRTLKCSGAISVTVGDTKASKEVNFTVQQTSDGKTSVSVEPFQF
jgi:hypothetical protein